MEMLVTDYEPDTGHVEAMDDDNESHDLHMHAGFEGTSGKGKSISGPEFVKLWDEAQELGHDMLIEVLVGPVKTKGGAKYVYQIVSAQVKDPDA